MTSKERRMAHAVVQYAIHQSILYILEITGKILMFFLPHKIHIFFYLLLWAKTEEENKLLPFSIPDGTKLTSMRFFWMLTLGHIYSSFAFVLVQSRGKE